MAGMPARKPPRPPPTRRSDQMSFHVSQKNSLLADLSTIAVTSLELNLRCRTKKDAASAADRSGTANISVIPHEQGRRNALSQHKLGIVTPHNGSRRCVAPVM